MSFHSERLEVAIPSRLAGGVIGAKGCNIKRIQRACPGLQTCRVVESRCVLLVGSFYAVEKASAMVEELVTSLHQPSRRRKDLRSIDGFIPHFGVQWFRSCDDCAVRLSKASRAAAKHLGLIAGRPSTFGSYVLEKTDNLDALSEPEPERDVPTELQKMNTVVGPSSEPLEGYLRLIFKRLGALTEMREHYVNFSIGKTFVEPFELEPTKAMSLDEMAAKLSSMRKQYSTGGITDAHAAAAQAWCRDNGFVLAEKRKFMAVHVKNTKMKNGLEFTFSLPENEESMWETVADLSQLEVKSELAPHRLGFITTHEPGEETLEFRVAFKALKPEESLNEELLNKVVAAWDRHRLTGECLALDDGQEYFIDSMRYKTSQVWANTRHSIFIDRVTQSWCESDEDASFWTVILAGPPIEKIGWLSLSEGEFVDEVMQIIVRGQELVDYLNQAC
ncbi:unnamed protein product [Aphanomyces euteiches]|uniref:K Homology domain-containing protein n=1 Tax=Aphanomyces euteiches TaxID=100861 RepID=A0A6G0XND6_9STRA|nr:hypothetical protein Ae201684_003015 [Aphanomyces euteiches]KAH9098587.1 hypothetical protein Ae201684P_017799 [Aphanomyces euteiches]KAH9134932.1 hypothetical protein AeRB84_019437 [Aphanomyces euteiches]